MIQYIFLILWGFGGGAGAQALDCSRPMNSLPDLQRPAGSPDIHNPIEHIIVIMQENHSFDQYFGELAKPSFYGSEVEGLAQPKFNLDKNGLAVSTYHESKLCPIDPDHTWDAEHTSWNGGANDGFVRTNGPEIMGHYDETDLPYYYALANQFAVGDHYFCAALTQTFPNRFFLMTGTSFGHIRNDLPDPQVQFAQKTIFDVLNQYHVSWKYYKDEPGYIGFFQPLYIANPEKMGLVADFAKDLKSDSLPQVLFIDSSSDGEDEHPSGNIQEGQKFVAARMRELIASPQWRNSVLFLTYDENGGFFDHVAPPQACAPDDIPPLLRAGDQPGSFATRGFRVPFVAISPYVKRHYVSHHIYDHTSILKFIETKFNLPALTVRDANADGLTDFFDFQNPVFSVNLPDAGMDQSRMCH